MTPGEKQALEGASHALDNLRSEISEIRKIAEKPGRQLRAGPGIKVDENLITCTVQPVQEAEAATGTTVVINAFKNGALIPLQVLGTEGSPNGPWGL